MSDLVIAPFEFTFTGRSKIPIKGVASYSGDIIGLEFGDPGVAGDPEVSNLVVHIRRALAHKIPKECLTHGPLVVDADFGRESKTRIDMRLSCPDCQVCRERLNSLVSEALAGLRLA